MTMIESPAFFSRGLYRYVLVLCTAIATPWASAMAASHDDSPRGRSPLRLVASLDGDLYVAESTGQAIAVVDVSSRSVTDRIQLPADPSGLAITFDQQLIVTAGQADGQLLRVDPGNKSVTVLADRLHCPSAPLFDFKHNVIYVAEPFRDRIVVFSPQGVLVDEIPVSRQPCALATGHQCRVVVAAHELPTGRADRGYVASVVSLIDPRSHRVQQITLPNGSVGLRGIAVDPEGHYAYVTHVLARYRLPAMQLERGWMNTNALSIIDLEKREYLNTVLLDEIDRGAANPWGVAFSTDGNLLCIAHAGTHELSVIDRQDLHRKLRDVHQGKMVTAVSKQPDQVPNDLAFLVGSRKRIPLPGSGPRSVAVVGDEALIGMYFTDEIAVVNLASTPPRATETIDLDRPQEMSLERQGEMHFHDATTCFQTWQSCASCHPGQARVDGLNWDLLNDGIGNPKNTKSLLFSHRTPPVMATGVRADAETAVRSGLRHIQFTIRPEAEAAAIDAYLKGLQPVPSPYLVDGELSASAKRGQLLFDPAGCSRCHSGPLMTGGQAFDVGTGTGQEHDRPMDTPSLVEVWRTSPYLHDGRAATIAEVLTEFNPDDRHGITSNLSEGEIKDLEQYVLSQ